MIDFAQLETGAIKIGSTDNLEARLSQLGTHYGKSVALLATLPGDRDQEHRIHERFAHLRIGRTEQFRPGADLLQFIGKPLLVSADPNAVEAVIPRGFQPGTVSIKFDKVLAGRARVIAQGRGIPMAEYLSEATRPIIDRDYAKLMRELEGGAQ